ncbi:MAG: ParB/RepB/Spo0J family partition protein [Minisyncoccia bacterium]
MGSKKSGKRKGEGVKERGSGRLNSAKSRVLVASTATHHCDMIASGVAGEEACRNISGTPARGQNCGECSSPFRLCFTCVLKGMVTGKSTVVRGTLLCVVHLNGGAEKESVKNGSVEDGLAEYVRDQQIRVPSEGPAQKTVVPKTVLAVVTADTAKPPPKTFGMPASTIGVAPIVYSAKMIEAGAKLRMAIESAGKPVTLNIERVKRFEGQPRDVFIESSLREIGESIKNVGQIQPVYVVKISGDSKYDYQLVDGERRLLGMKSVGLKKIQALVLSIDDDETRYLISAMANFGREGHTYMEIANVVHHLVKSGLTIAEVAITLSKSKDWVHKHHSLLKLDESVQAMLDPRRPRGETLSFVVATVLAGYPNKSFQKKMADHIVTNKLRLVAADLHIRKSAVSANVHSERPQKRSPSKEYRTFCSFLDNLASKADAFLAMDPDGLFEIMFPDDVARDADRGKLQVLSQKLLELAERI